MKGEFQRMTYKFCKLKAPDKTKNKDSNPETIQFYFSLLTKIFHVEYFSVYRCMYRTILNPLIIPVETNC